MVLPALLIATLAAAPVRVTVAGVLSPEQDPALIQLAPSLQSAFAERMMRGLLSEGFVVRGPGDEVRRLGPDGRAALLRCLARNECTAAQLQETGSDAVVFLSATGLNTMSIVAVMADGTRLDSWTVASPLALVGDRIEATMRKVATEVVERGLRRDYAPPPPWVLWGHAAVVSGAVAAAASTLLFVDATLKYEQLRSGRPTDLPPLEAFQLVQTGRWETVAAVGTAATAAGLLVLAVHLYGRDRPRVPAESLRVDVAVTPSGIQLVAAW